MSIYTISLIITFDKRDTPAPPGVGVCFYGGFSFFFSYWNWLRAAIDASRIYSDNSDIHIFFGLVLGKPINYEALGAGGTILNGTRAHSDVRNMRRHAGAGYVPLGGPMFAMLLMLRVIGTNTAARRRFIGANDTCKWPYNDSRVVYVCAKWTTCETL